MARVEMSPRSVAVRDAIGRKPVISESHRKASIDKFGHLTFNRKIMERVLPKDICANIFRATNGKDKINPDYADTIAQAMKDWAVNLGATHFCHWFQPLTGGAAEKHDAFIDWKSTDVLIEKFSGKQLLQGEPDASSFPSGGLRSTSEARGYTAWDPSSLPFLWRLGGSVVLCIPSVYFSWTGKALDMKIPLLRSDQKISDACMRLLKLEGIRAQSVYCTLGCEQEYFLIDRALFSLRPDLVMAGRTVFGAPSPKSQELEDHYFGAVKERVLAYMRDFERKAFELGVPLKTRHNEVAPAQHEVAPVFEKGSLAIDHNMLMMELMKQIAMRHNLACLLHEKPFKGINGSGKHNNWSLATDTGINLLSPSSSDDGMVFLILITAVLHAVHENAALLRASIASLGNDERLGGHEAPPAIISVYLGEALERILNEIEGLSNPQSLSVLSYDLGISSLPELPKDSSDRNRTSPFAFTGCKFEFRAVGASANCALPITVLNVIVAESLNLLLNEIEEGVSKHVSLKEAALPVLRKYLALSKPIRYHGDNYASVWKEEAQQRGLPFIENSFEAFKTFIEPKTIQSFTGVLSEEELRSRYNVMVDHYRKRIQIETRLMSDLFHTQILPAALEYQKQFAKSVHLVQQAGASAGKTQINLLQKLVEAIDKAIESIHVLEEKSREGETFCEVFRKYAGEARHAVDHLETLCDDRLWPLPKYRELLSNI